MTGSTSATTSLPSTSTTTATTSPTTGVGSTTMPTAGDSADSGSTSTTTGMSTESSTTGPACGDGVVDDTEMCDGTPGCTKDCEFENYGCNPLNNVPCTQGFKCSMFNDIKGNAATECRVFLEPPPGQLYESNCYSGEPRDEWCDIGLACVTSQSTNACEVNCCVEFCDRLDPTFECNFKGDMCLASVGDLAPTGMEWLGICITP